MNITQVGCYRTPRQTHAADLLFRSATSKNLKGWRDGEWVEFGPTQSVSNRTEISGSKR